MTYHLTIGGDPWCNWTGCAAGQRIAEKAGVRTCSCTSKREAESRRAALAPHFREGAVQVIKGPCPEDLRARLEIGRDYTVRPQGEQTESPPARLVGFYDQGGVRLARLIGEDGATIGAELDRLKLIPRSRGLGVDFRKQAHDAGVLWMVRYSIGGASGSNAFGTYAEGYSWLAEQAARLRVDIPQDAIPSTPEGGFVGWSYEAANGAKFGIRRR